MKSALGAIDTQRERKKKDGGMFKLLGAMTRALGDLAVREVEILGKAAAYSLVLETMRGARRLSRYYMFSQATLIVFAATTAAAVVYGVEQFSRSGRLYFDFFWTAAIVVGAGCLFAFRWLMSEERWLSAFRLQRQVAAVGRQAQAISQRASALSAASAGDTAGRHGAHQLFKKPNIGRMDANEELRRDTIERLTEGIENLVDQLVEAKVQAALSGLSGSLSQNAKEKIYSRDEEKSMVDRANNRLRAKEGPADHRPLRPGEASA